MQGRVAQTAQAMLLASVAVTGMGQTLVFAILPSLGRASGLADVQVGLIITCSAFVFALASPIWGRLSEYIGRKPVIVIGLSGYAIGTLGFALTFEAGIRGWLPSSLALLALLILARCLQAAVMAASPPAASAYMADITSLEGRTRGMGRIGAAHNLGTVFGPALGGLVASVWLVLPLYLVVGITAAMAIWVALGLRESPYISTRPEPTVPFRLADAARHAFVAYRDPRIRDVLWLGILMFMAFAIVQQTLGFMYQDRFLLDPAQAARGVGFAMMAAAVSSLLAQAVIVQRLSWPPERLLRVAMPAMAAGFALLAWAPVPLIAAIGIAVTGLGLGLGMPGISAAASLRVSADEQGNVAGLMAACPAMGFILGPVLGTGLYEVEPHMPYLLVMVLAVPLVLASWKIRTEGAQV